MYYDIKYVDLEKVMRISRVEADAVDVVDGALWLELDDIPEAIFPPGTWISLHRVRNDNE